MRQQQAPTQRRPGAARPDQKALTPALSHPMGHPMGEGWGGGWGEGGTLQMRPGSPRPPEWLDRAVEPSDAPGRMLTGDLPESKGTYVLIAYVAQMKRLEIGSLGAQNIVPGFYLYVGSAFGAGGLRARIGHHLEPTSDPHWHIDYLLALARPVEVWFTTAERKLEYHWAELCEKAFRMPIARFGASDYHRSRSSHLFYCKRRPAFAWFQQELRNGFEGIHAERFLVPAPPLHPQVE